MAATVSLICDRLRDEILAGDLSPGQQSTQSALAEKLGVSRTPLREALRMLELEGLVIRESNGRVRISSLSLEHVEDLATMRINLEVVAVSLTVNRFGHAEHAKLEGLLAQIERFAAVGDWAGIEAPHREFHHMLVSGAGDRITAALAQMWAHASRYRSIAFRRVADHVAEWDINRLEHRGMVDAYEAYDAPSAASWVVTQIARTAIVAADDIDPKHPLTRVHDLLERYTGSAELPEASRRGGTLARR